MVVTPETSARGRVVEVRVDVEQPRYQVIARAVDGAVAGWNGGPGAGDGFDPATTDQHSGILVDAVLVAVEHVAVDQREAVGAGRVCEKNRGNCRQEQKSSNTGTHGLRPDRQRNCRPL